MQTLFLGKTNRITLNTGKPVDDVKLSILTSTGTAVKDSNGADITNITATDGGGDKFYLDINLFESTNETDIYIYWVCSNNSISVVLEDEYDPEDGIIKKQVDTEPLLISPTYLMNNYLRGITVADIEETFVGEGYRSTLKRQIRAATDHLQREVMVHFTPKTVTGERHTFYMSEIPEKFWTVRLYNVPIISVNKIQLKLNDYEIVEEIPSGWIQTENPKDGMVSIIPYAGGVAAFVFRIVTQGGMGAALLFGEASNIPGFFSYDYTTGIDWDNIHSTEKEDIKSAIGRQVAIHFLPNLDIHRGISSESDSIDGASSSRSYTSSATFGEHSAAIEAYIKQQKMWVNQFKRKYLTRLPMDGYTP